MMFVSMLGIAAGCWSIRRNLRLIIVVFYGRPAEAGLKHKRIQRLLKRHDLISSMSAVGHCADNAACEGFFGVMKRERINPKNYRTQDEARSDIFDYIERFY